MKKILYMMVIASILGVVSLSDVFASDSCEGVCTNPPTNLDNYLKTMDDLIDLIPVNPLNPRSGNDAPIADEIQSSLLLQRSILNEVLINKNNVPDIFGEIKALSDGPIRKRDRDSLVEVDEKIMRRLQPMVKNGNTGIIVDQSSLEQIDQTIQKIGPYIRLRKFNDGQYVMDQSGVKWEEYVSMLRALNGIYKELHKKKWYHDYLMNINNNSEKIDTKNVEDMTKQPSKEALGYVNRDLNILKDKMLLPLTDGIGGSFNERLEFDFSEDTFPLAIWEIQEQYDCAIGVQNLCDTGQGSWAEAASKSWDYTKDRWNNDGNRAIDTFKRSWSRLKATLFSASDEDEEAAKQRQNQLMSSIYGRGVPERETWWKAVGAGIDENVESAPMTRTAIVKLYERLWKKEKNITQSGNPDVPSNLAGETDKSEQADNTTSEKKYDTTEKKKSLLEEYKDYFKQNEDYQWTAEDTDLRGFLQTSQLDRTVRSFRGTYDSVIAMQQQFEVQTVLLDTNPVTKRFPALSASVYKNMDLRGDKNDPGNSAPPQGLYQAMGKVCEEQCSNLGGKCRYITE